MEKNELSGMNIAACLPCAAAGIMQEGLNCDIVNNEVDGRAGHRLAPVVPSICRKSSNAISQLTGLALLRSISHSYIMYMFPTQFLK